MKLHGRTKDLTGQHFGRLTAIEPTNKRSGSSVVWLCKCDCGNEKGISSNDLRRGSTKSCGCLQKEISKKLTIKRNTLVDGTNINFLTQKTRSDNTSGHKGVYWNKRQRKWHAQIHLRGKNYHLGYFENIQDAIDARKAAEEELFEPMIEKYKEEHE